MHLRHGIVARSEDLMFVLRIGFLVDITLANVDYIGIEKSLTWSIDIANFRCRDLSFPFRSNLQTFPLKRLTVHGLYDSYIITVDDTN